MRTSRLMIVLVRSGATLALALTALAWTLGTASSEAQLDAMHGCPQRRPSAWPGATPRDPGQAHLPPPGQQLSSPIYAC